MFQEDSSFDITDTQEIFRALRALELSKSLVTLKIAGSDKSFSSMIVGCNLRRKSFLLDEVQPQEGNRLIANGQKFSIHGNYDGIRISAKGLSAKSDHLTSQGKDEKVKIPCFKAPIPKAMLYRQRREAFRVDVQPVSWVTMTNDKHSFIKGQILDVSTDGVGCRFEGYIQPELEPTELFARSELSVNQTFNLNCQLKVRHPRYHKLENATYCGFSFVDLDNYYQRRLDRFILDLQRKLRKEQQRAANF